MKKSKELTKIQDKPDGKIKKFFHKCIDVLNKKWLRNGINTLLLVAIIILICVGITVLLKNVNLPEIDCTSDKIYSLSEETKTKISGIDKDIKITLINYSSNENMNDIIKKYKALNNNISVETIDNLSSRSDLMTEYSLKSTDTLIIVSSGEKESTIDEYSLYTYDYTTGKQIDTTEEAITNAIIEVTSDVKPKVYIMMNNHMAYPTSYYSTFMQELKDDANDVETFDLFVTGKVPDDCSCLVITTLKEDITEAEKDSIIEYINKGGKILLLSGSNTRNVVFTNFQQILDLYGITIEDGVVFEGTDTNMLYQYPDMIIENTQSISNTNMNMTLKGCFVDAAPIKVIEDSDKQDELGVSYETLATTSSTAFVRTNLNITSANRTSQDSEAGTQTIGVLATKEIDDKTTSKLIVYSNEFFTTDMPIQIGNYQYTFISICNNNDIAANAVAYLNEKENTITIRKNYDTVTYTPTKAEQKVVMCIIFITPFVIIAIGLVVKAVRKRKK